jgi:hypothetical protein
MLSPSFDHVNGDTTPRGRAVVVHGVPTLWAQKLAPPEFLQKCCTETTCRWCGMEIMVVAARLEQVTQAARAAACPVLILCPGCAEAAAACASEVTEVRLSNPELVARLARHAAEQN